MATLDGTFGMLFVGMTFSSVLYGATCFQTFMYATSPRTKEDKRFLKAIAYVALVVSYLTFALELLDTGHYIGITSGMYRYFITYYAQPVLLNAVNPGSGSFDIFVGILCGLVLIFITQLFFAVRLWNFMNKANRHWERWVLVTIAVFGAFLTFAVAVNIIIPSTGLGAFTSLNGARTAWELNLIGAIICDVVLTSGLIYNLYRSRTHVHKTNQVLNSLVVLTLNTGLITAILATIALFAFYLLVPRLLLYVAIELILPRCYVNSLFAILNSRDYLREQLIRTPQVFVTVRLETGQEPSVAHFRLEDDHPTPKSKRTSFTPVRTPFLEIFSSDSAGPKVLRTKSDRA